MIRLLRFEAVNFRSLGSVVLEPATDSGSMTALVGPNGSGKSSVIHALAWALYGETPEGVTVAGLKRQGAATSDECFVTVTFEHDRQIVSVTRAIKGARNATVALVSVDGVEVSVSSTKSATAWVSRRLGMDADAFLTAVLVRQKELEDLLRARPADRKRLVERLAGIERMSAAVSVARERELARKRSVESAGDPEAALASVELDVAHASQGVSEAQSVVDQLSSQEAGAREAAVAAHAVAESTQRAWDESQLQVNQLVEAQSAEREAKALLEHWVQRVESARAVLPDPCPSVAAVQAEVESLRNAQDKARQAVRDAQEEELSRQRLSQELQVAQQNEERARSSLAAVTESLESVIGKLDASGGDPAEDVESARRFAKVADELVGQLRAEYQRLKAAISAFDAGTVGCCPTCQQDVPDPRELVALLQGQLRDVELRGKAAREEAESAGRAFEVARKREQEYRELAAERERLESAVTGGENEVATLANITLLAQKSLQEGSNAPQAILTPDAAQVEYEAVLGRLRASEGLLEALQAHTEATQGAERAREGLQSATAALQSLQSPEPTPGEPAVTSSALQSAWEAANAAEKAASAALHNLTQARGDLAVAEERLAAHKKRQQQAQDAVRARKDAIVAWERATHIREGLEGFRADRLERLLPELSDATSDLVAHMTSGRFSAVQLDDNFTPFVTDDSGNTRPASWLSGGEEAIVALAMRIGIGEIVSGGKGGLLALDEVLTAQDSSRRQSMMTAIRGLPGRQVIMVNHVTEASDLADEVFEFIPMDPTTGEGARCERMQALDVSAILEAI